MQPGFFQPGFNGLLPTVVSRERLGLVNARIQTIQSVFTAVGPAVGSMAAVGLGLRNAMWLDGGAFALAAILFLGLRRMPVIASNESPLTNGFTPENIWQYLKNRPDLLYGILLFAGTNFGLMAIESNIIFIVARYLALPQVLAGVVLGFGDLGAVVGSLVATWFVRRAYIGRIVVFSMAIAGLLTLAIAIANWIILAMAWCLVSAVVSVIVVVWLTFQEQTVPSEFLGRLTALGTMASFAAIPAGAIVGGYFIGAQGNLLALALVAGGVQTTAAGIGSLSPLWWDILYDTHYFKRSVEQ